MPIDHSAVKWLCGISIKGMGHDHRCWEWGCGIITTHFTLTLPLLYPSPYHSFTPHLITPSPLTLSLPSPLTLPLLHPSPYHSFTPHLITPFTPHLTTPFTLTLPHLHPSPYHSFTPHLTTPFTLHLTTPSPLTLPHPSPSPYRSFTPYLTTPSPLTLPYHSFTLTLPYHSFTPHLTTPFTLTLPLLHPLPYHSLHPHLTTPFTPLSKRAGPLVPFSTTHYPSLLLNKSILPSAGLTRFHSTLVQREFCSNAWLLPGGHVAHSPPSGCCQSLTSMGY